MVGWKKAMNVFGKKEAPDSPRLQHKHTWGIDEQRQHQQEHFPATPQRVSDDPINTVSARAESQTPKQDDWFTAALQQSAQLSELAKQEQAEEEQDRKHASPKANRKRGSKLRQRGTAQRPEQDEEQPQQDEDWFNKALKQSAQLDGL